METYLIGSLLGLGTLLSKNKVKRKTIKKELIPENEKPSQNNVYSSNYVNETRRLEFDKGMKNWNKSLDKNSKILPAAYKNHYGSTDYVNYYESNTGTRYIDGEYDQNGNRMGPMVIGDDEIKPLENPLAPSTNDGVIKNQEKMLPETQDLMDYGVLPANERQHTLAPLGDSFEMITDKYKNIKNNAMILETRPGEYRIKGMDWSKGGHSNMQPNKRKGTQNMNPNANRHILESFTGTLPVYPHKKELKRFKPLEKQWVFGTPIEYDRQEERYSTTIKKNGILPIEQVRVPPGLNQGYNNKTNIVRYDTYRPHIKDVNELRVNPKNVYKGREIGGPKFHVSKRQQDVLNYKKKTTNNRYLTNFTDEPNTTDIKVRDLIPTRYGSGGTKGKNNNQDTVILKDTQKELFGNVYDTNVTNPHGNNHNYYDNKDTIRVSNKPTFSVNPIEAIKMGEGTYKFDRTTNKMKTTIKEQTVKNLHKDINPTGPRKERMQLKEGDKTKTTIKEQTLFSHNGFTNGGRTKQRDRHGEENVQFNGIKELTIHNRGPNQRYWNKINDKNIVNMEVKKLQHNTYDLNKRVNKGWVKINNNIGETTVQKPQYEDKKLLDERIKPDILDAFKNNPYTQSLKSSEQLYNRAADIDKKNFDYLNQSKNIFKSFTNREDGFY